MYSTWGMAFTQALTRKRWMLSSMPWWTTALNTTSKATLLSNKKPAIDAGFLLPGFYAWFLNVSVQT
ncbi:hypothetical protein THMIRHAM_20700 [Thiomicrorhabdus immobilis]|uniref:Uncharacterized protein n=1 Tax=Thiomicrorhabdus immobilis TaxID=2791037 RepID=A0ABN6CYS9_9GAMM|nr:hypothetical protein THMIRHAM_20700 [Thiomicrorhabdus immobilis]